MMKNIFVLVGLILISGSAAVLGSELTVSNSLANPGDTDVLITIGLDNAVAFAGCELVLEYDLALLDFNRIEAAPRLAGLSEFGYYHFFPGRISIVFFDITGINLPSDTGVVLNVYFDVTPDSSEGEAAIIVSEAIAVDDNLDYDIINVTNGTISFPAYLCGDLNGDRLVNILDITYYIAYLYKSGPEPVDFGSADVNSSGDHNILDITYLISFLYKGGPEPDCWGEPYRFASKKASETAKHAHIENISENGVTTISINSPVDLMGLEMILTTDAGTEIQIVSLVEDVPVYFNQSGDKIKLGMVDAKGKNLIPKGEHKIIKIDGTVAIDSVLGAAAMARPVLFGNRELLLPREFSLGQNYPNPFNPVTVIDFALPRNTQVRIDIFNILGQKVTTLIDRGLEAGYHSVTWDGIDSEGTEVASGMYFYKIRAGDFEKSRKMLLLK